jgi:hypothetical protein
MKISSATTKTQENKLIEGSHTKWNSILAFLNARMTEYMKKM